MITTATRRLALVLALGASTVATFGVAHAQTTVTPQGITGTDPVPKGCGCVTQPSPSSTSSTTPNTSTTSNGSTSGTVMQAMLVFLGLA